MKHTSSRVLTCPAEKPLALRRSWLLTNPAAPPALKWRADIYLCFLSGSVQFFVLNTASLCLFFFLPFLGAFTCSVASPPLFTVWVWAWTYLTRWGQALRLCGGGALPNSTVQGGGLPGMHEGDWHFSDTPLGSDWLCWSRSSGFLQIKLQPLGGATDSWPVSYSTVRS